MVFLQSQIFTMEEIKNKTIYKLQILEYISVKKSNNIKKEIYIYTRIYIGLH